jgi:hypothetical protein
MQRNGSREFSDLACARALQRAPAMKILSLIILAAGLTGCTTTYTSLAQGPTTDKVYVTKTTSYYVWSKNTMEVCTLSGQPVSDCHEIREK